MSDNHRTAVINILNHFIRHSYAAYSEEAVDYHFFDRIVEMSRGYPALVIKTGDHQVVGFGIMRPHHFADSFKRTAEVTYFILPENTRKGLGTAMLDRFVRESGQMGIDSLLANISSRNEESIRFHLQNGFRECGRFMRVGRKFGEDFDVVWMQRQLG
ncbi:MAG: N-acetyltransferase family protein [Thermodesulfobacteriota bacterium]